MNSNNQLFHNKIPQVKQEEFIRKRSYILINSKDRDVARDIQPESYTINFLDSMGCIFKNVESVRLISGTVPDVNNVRDEPFLLLDINELNGSYSKIYSSDNQVTNIFDVVRFSNNLTSSKFVYLQPGISNFYKPTLAKLTKLTIRFRKQDGSLFSWGDDTVFNDVRQNSLMFEVTELIHNTYMINERLTY